MIEMMHFSLEYTEFPHVLFAHNHWLCCLLPYQIPLYVFGTRWRGLVEFVPRPLCSPRRKTGTHWEQPGWTSPSPHPVEPVIMLGGGGRKIIWPYREWKLGSSSSWSSCCTDYIMPAALFVRADIKLLQNPVSIFRGMLVGWLAGGVSVISHLLPGYCHYSKNDLFFYCYY
jgi:hypothetical protein